MIRLPHSWQGWLRWLAVPWAIGMFLAFTWFALVCLYPSRRCGPAYGTRAPLTMRALGSSQLAFQDQNIHHRYGTWKDMLATGYVQPGYTRSNMIDNYSISVWNVGYGPTPSFTIVVVPRNMRDQKLREFSITDDQTVRSRTFEERKNGVPPWRWEPLR